MNKSFIYSSIKSDDMASLGYFEPKAPYERLANTNHVKFINESVNITRNTLIAYFPGCFAEFHIGHLDVVNQAIAACKAITDDYLVVISPANSDYTTEKYGKRSLFATNQYRYERMCYVLNGVDGNVAIDLNPMLNYKVDYNFTDLVFDFVCCQGLVYAELLHTPRIVCGKDRDYFGNLKKVTNKIDVIYVEDTTGASSSAYIKTVKDTAVPRKHLLLRVEHYEQYEQFDTFFADQYASIDYILLNDEIEQARKLHAIEKFDVTICKDYADFLPYVRTHRRFENPLERGNGHITEGTFKGLKVLDSDIFSGGTKNFIANQGGSLYAIHNFEKQLDTHELLDIADFYDDKFDYPYVDISSRCSMRAFDLELHTRFAAFKNLLKGIRRV